eukprot:309715_1
MLPTESTRKGRQELDIMIGCNTITFSNVTWHRGNVCDIGKNLKFLVMKPSKGSEIYKFDPFLSKSPTYYEIIPSTLSNWFPLNYFHSGEEMLTYDWCNPKFEFMSSFTMSASLPIFSGWIKYNNTDKYRGSIEIISGFIPYPAHKAPPKVEIESKLNINNFIKQFSNNNNKKICTAKYISWQPNIKEK